jgi:DNA-directed RNA polymerase subunit M/transcription elongation factor TFIIS
MNNELFCDHCGKILEIVKSKKGDIFGLCDCGSVKILKKDIESNESINQKKEIGTGIIKEVHKKGFPHKCSKCGHNEAEVYDLGASYSDESNTWLFKCTKCNHVDREGYGTGSK